MTGDKSIYGARLKIFAILIAAILALAPHPSTAEVAATPNKALSKLLLGFESNLNKYIGAASTNSWGDAHQVSEVLTKTSLNLRNLADAGKASSWRFYASNLFHHSLELELATKQGNIGEVIYLLATMFEHLGQIQAANPIWLRDQVRLQLSDLKGGIENKDKERVRLSAEVIHASANKIVLSAALEPRAYKHVRWLNSINTINQLGDAIIGRVNKGEWNNLDVMYAEIEHTLNKWDTSFR